MEDDFATKGLKKGDVIRMSLVRVVFLDVTLHDYGANVIVECPFVLGVLCMWLQEVDVTHGSCFVCAWRRECEECKLIRTKQVNERRKKK